MPLKDRHSDDFAIAFAHPNPYWEKHYLIVPKKRLLSFMSIDLTQSNSMKYIASIFSLTQILASNKKLVEYSILVNGGLYQDVPQIHFHLLHGLSKEGEVWGMENYEPPSENSDVLENRNALAYLKPNPNREFHYIISSKIPKLNINYLQTDANILVDLLVDILILAQKIINQNQLKQYSLITNFKPKSANLRLTFHLVSGERV